MNNSPVRIEVKLRDQGGADDYSGFTPYQTPQPDNSGPTDYSSFTPYGGAAAKSNAPQVGTAEAAGSGVAEGMTFGTAPLFEGLSAAAGPEWNQSQTAHEFAPFVGAGKMFSNMLSSHPNPAVREAFERGRKDALEKQSAAAEQHPWAYGGGQLAAALMTPIPGLGGGAGIVGRVGRAALAGGVAGGLGGAGEAASQEQSPGEIAQAGLGGTATGAAFGGLGGGAMEALAKAGKLGTGIVRGFANPEAQAMRNVSEQLVSDAAAHGPSLTPEELAASRSTGIQPAIVDIGGTGTVRRLQAAANASPEAAQAIDKFVKKRFAGQSERIAGSIRRMTGAFDAGADEDALRQAARAANRPAYQRAYAAGDRPVQVSDQIMSAPAVRQAMASAVERGQNRAVVDGFGGFNPGVRVTQDGRLEFQRGRAGVPTYPNIQFWDYAQRELRDAASQADRAGRNEEAGALKGLHHQLLSELDRHVPEFADARGTAHVFFGARDALEAGQNYVERDMRPEDARRALMKMSKPEQELFRRGFASELANRVLDLRNRQDAINQGFLDSPNASKKIRLVLGNDRANELEALLRAETVFDRPRQVLGNSTTARQLGDLKKFGHSVAGHAAGAGTGAGALGAIEYLKEQHVEPAHILAAALIGAGAKHGAHIIDERVARHVGQLLVSNDLGKLQEGLQIVTRRPVLFNALRAVTGAGARVSAHKLGPAGSVALGSALLHSGADEEGGSTSDILSDQSSQ